MFWSFRHLIGRIVSAMGSRKDLILENPALRQQLSALHAQRCRPRLSVRHKLFWVLMRRLWSGWKTPLLLVTPRTVVEWHRAGFLAGVYPTDLQGSPQTRNGQIHNQVSMIAFPCATLALPLLSLPLRWDKRLRPVWRSTMLLSLLVIASFLASHWFGERQLPGVDQLVFLGSTLIWMWALGVKMLAIEKQSER